MTEPKPKVILGMSGGVDSSASLVMLARAGFDVVGVSFKYDTWRDPENPCRENVCCTPESFKIAADICRKYGVEHHIVDISEEFNKEVIEYFKSELKTGRTPSPCVICNRKIKFHHLIKFADKVGAKFIATGHYARVKKNKSGQFELLRAKDLTKDQTYSLSYLTQAELSRVIFPLGIFTKDEVYDFAKKEGIGEIFDKVKQSQDFCFVSGRSLKNFIAKEIGTKPGEIIDESGAVLGIHDGVYFYTIGQRKDIGLSGGPYYVVGKDLAKNQVTVSKNPEKFATGEIIFDEFNLINEISGSIEVEYKLRSAQPVRKGILSSEGKKLKLTFSNSETFVTPGQVAVFYVKDVCLGMGIIG